MLGSGNCILTEKLVHDLTLGEFKENRNEGRSKSCNCFCRNRERWRKCQQWNTEGSGSNVGMEWRGQKEEGERSKRNACVGK